MKRKQNINPILTVFQEQRNMHSNHDILIVMTDYRAVHGFFLQRIVPSHISLPCVQPVNTVPDPYAKDITPITDTPRFSNNQPADQSSLTDQTDIHIGTLSALQGQDLLEGQQDAIQSHAHYIKNQCEKCSIFRARGPIPRFCGRL